MTSTELIFFLVLCVYLAFSLFLDGRLLYSEEKVERIKSKLETLKALIKDHDQLGIERCELEARLRLFWDLEDLFGIHLQLSEAENEWIKSSKDVVKEAEDCVVEYYKQHKGLFWGTLTATLRWSPIRVVLHKLDGLTFKLTEHFIKREEKANDIYRSMENARSKNRRLLDQYTIEVGDTSAAEHADNSVAAQNQKQKKPSPSIDELLMRSTDPFSSMEERWSIYLLLPLHAFVKELRQLRIETETEKLWKTEAEEIIKDAEVCIGNYLWWFQYFSICTKFNIDMLLTHQFREDMKLIVSDYNALLTRKGNYNLTFIDTAAEKSTFISVTDDREIVSVIKSIGRKLKDEELSQVDQMNSLHGALKETFKQLRRAEETAARNACIEQLKSIAKEVDNFLEMYMNYGPELQQREFKNAIDLLQNIIRNCTIERQESTQVVGLKNEVRDLVWKLTRISDDTLELSIVGMKGVGKTTLAKAVYYNKEVVEHFPIRVWVTVTEGAGIEAKVLLMKKDGTKDQTLNVRQVCEHLKEKLCLVVLDDVSKKEDLSKLYVTITASGWTKGSKIVMTTRFKGVALLAETQHYIRLLTKEESWALFQKVADIKKLEPKLESFAKKVVGKCGGLPFAIVSLGYAVSAKGITKESLSWVLKQFNHGHHKTHWLRAWDKNIQELHRTTRNCLYYFTNFPVDYEIPARRLINLWVAEGLAQQENGKTPEETAERHLEDMRDRNVIQVVTLNSNGKIKTWRLPSMLREIILQNSNRTYGNQYMGTHLDRRFAYHFDDLGLDTNSGSTQPSSKEGIPLSVLFFDKREGSKPGEDVGKILLKGISSEQFLKIKVLDLECVFRPQLPKTVSKLNNLTYLSLRWTYLEEFPMCICKLSELETLDLKHTSISVIPRSIWRLKKLKKLFMSEKYRSKIEGNPRGDFHENLHTLGGLFLYGSYPLLGYLYKLKNLQKLKLAFQLEEETEQDKLLQNIVKLEQLDSLRLRSVNETGGAEKLKLKSLSRLNKLSSLQLFGELEISSLKLLRELEDISILPQNLAHLTLSASKLSDDPMPELQNLPKLRSLCFYADSYTGEKMVCVSGSFQQLQVLRFWNIESFKEWDVERGAMPRLIEFEVRSCKNLEFPSGLKHLETIKMIKIRKMPKRFRKDKRLKALATLLVNVEIND